MLEVAIVMHGGRPIRLTPDCGFRDSERTAAGEQSHADQPIIANWFVKMQTRSEFCWRVIWLYSNPPHRIARLDHGRDVYCGSMIYYSWFRTDCRFSSNNLNVVNQLQGHSKWSVFPYFSYLDYLIKFRTRVLRWVWSVSLQYAERLRKLGKVVWCCGALWYSV